MEQFQPLTESILFEKGKKGHKRPRHDATAELPHATPDRGPGSAKKKKSNRKYNESYLKYGFICAGELHDQRPLCVVCGDTLSNDALKPSKLLRHFESRHPELKNMPLEYFEQRKPLVEAIKKEAADQVSSVAKIPSAKTPTKVKKEKKEKKEKTPKVKKEKKPKKIKVQVQVHNAAPTNQVPSVVAKTPTNNVVALPPESTSTNPSPTDNVAALRQPQGSTSTNNVAAPPAPLRQPQESTSSRQPHESTSSLSPSTNVVALRVGLSNLVASLIGEIKEPFTISEELILPACELIFREILGESAANNIAAHVHPPEDEIAEDIEAQLLERIRKSPWYALQVDESTDLDNRAVVLVYVRYVFQDDVQEDLLCPLSLPTNATAAELFMALFNYMSERLDWSFCVGLSTDGSAAMTGRHSGFSAMVKQVAPECQLTHCVIRRELLASQKLYFLLHDVVTMINHVKAQAVNSHLFEQLCGDTDTELKCLLLNTEVRWLSRGRTLARVFELRGPLQRFLAENNSPLAALFSDEEWVAKLAYLSDIFNLLNEFNLSLQGRMVNVFTMAEKVAALKAKLALWGRRVNKGSFDMFHSLAEVLGETETVPSVSQLVRDHLVSLSVELERYFPTTKETKAWVRDPFVNVPGDESSLSMEEWHQLIDEVANDGGLKSLFWITSSLPTFWIKVGAAYPGIATKALKALLPFPTTSLCEAGFASMMARKTELRNRLDINNTLRVSLSRTPRLDRLVARKHAHPHPLRKENGSH